jgi:hypothetical protein
MVKKKSNYNAALTLVMDFYHMEELTLALQEQDYRLVEGEKQNDLPRSVDEVFAQIYYKQDAFVGRKDEGAVTESHGGIAFPALIRIGQDSFSSLRTLLGALSHELTHARQTSSGKPQSESAKELFAYQTNLKGAFAGRQFPQNRGVSAKVGDIEHASEYYWKFTDIDQQLKHYDVIMSFVANGRAAIPSEHVQQIKEYVKTAKNEFSSGGTTIMGNKGLEFALQEAAVMYDVTSILNVALGVLNSIRINRSPVAVSQINAIETAYSTALAAEHWSFSATGLEAGYGRYLEDDFRKQVQTFYSNTRAGLNSTMRNVIASMRESANMLPDGNDKAVILERIQKMEDGLR